jgi:hypothetical protein
MKNENAIGLDIGTSRIVAAKRNNGQDQIDAQLNAFVSLPHSKLTEAVFAKESVPYFVSGGEILVFGNEAPRLAGRFNRDARRPMMAGLLNAGEPSGTEMINRIISAVLGEATQGTRLCFSVPGAPPDSPESLTYHEKTLHHMLSKLGYQVSSVNEGLAVILSELAETNYTGIGISFGGGMCNVCMAYLSIPVFSFSVPKAGDFIDASAASVAGESLTRVRGVKEESFQFNGFFGDRIRQALTVYYDELIRLVASRLRTAVAQAQQSAPFDRPIPLVVSGGSSLPGGFVQRFSAALSEIDTGVQISDIRAAADPLNATAKGALVAALAGI